MTDHVYEYDGYATALERRTWADGYGNWHAVLETEGTGSTLPPASEADTGQPSRA